MFFKYYQLFHSWCFLAKKKKEPTPESHLDLVIMPLRSLLIWDNFVLFFILVFFFFYFDFDNFEEHLPVILWHVLQMKAVV